MAYLWKDVLKVIDRPHRIWICDGDVIGANPHKRAILRVHGHVAPWHIPVPDGIQLPEVGEAGDEGAWDVAKAVACVP